MEDGATLKTRQVAADHPDSGNDNAHADAGTKLHLGRLVFDNKSGP